jgi:pyrimidine operon attenuation protein/uracil phosphoribosyltransferase
VRRFLVPERHSRTHLARGDVPAYDAAFMSSQVPRRPVEIREKAQLMSASEIERTLIRLAHEIVEKNNGIEDLALVGIKRRGVPLAERLAKIIQRIEKKPVPVGTLDITLYRDDLSTLGAKPVVQKTELEFPVAGKSVVLVDDVLYTGRTTRGAMDALFRGGRPKRVQLCVLIDRGHRELPIEAAFVGRMVQTSANQIIEVKLKEIDDAEKVLLMEKQ